jgi:hypothetical protein
MWEPVYLYQGPNSHWSALAPGLLALAAVAAFLFIQVRNNRTANYSRSATALLAVLLVIIGDEVVWQHERNTLGVAAAAGKCAISEGFVTAIYPKTGGGQLAFVLGGHIFRYDNHQLALHSQLCEAGGPPLCVGDLGRVCLHNQTDGEILKLERFVKTLQAQ